MGDNADRENRHTDDLDKLPALFKEWLGVVGALGGAVAALLAVLLPQQTSARVQVIGYSVALALVGVGVFVFVRVRRRQRARSAREQRRAAWERETAGAHLAAFRGLLPYQDGDELPGEHRRLEARLLVTQFGEPTFSFGVVCGDSGCGKTSLLRSAIQRSLKAVGEERGFGVRYLSNPRELADAAPADGRDAASRLRGELERLRQITQSAAGGRPLILIIDQFEEFFIEYASPELRLELGRFLDGLIKSSPPVRILCAIRRDYLADMKDLAPADPDAARNFFEPLSLRGLFTLKNFTVEQAARVVAECAERDRIVLDEEFAATLASDLGDGDFVRPPELQIVCGALLGKMTLAEYRLAGGAGGILSHHVEDAIAVSGDADTGRRVLRALCDFPAHAKRNPQTVADLAGAVGAEGAQALALVRTALRRFEGARLVVSERSGASKERRGADKADKGVGDKADKRGADERRGAERSERGAEETGYALVHDYLVDAVSKATSDVTTRDEEANQMLAYYVAEYRTDHKTRIPYRRLRFVRKYADPKQLADPTARRLLRASVMRLVTSAVALAALVVFATTLLAALITTRRVWHQDIVGRHWEGNQSGKVKLYVQPKRGLLLTTIPDPKEDKVKLWDVREGNLEYSFNPELHNIILPDYILGYSKNSEDITAFHIPTRREFSVALPVSLIPNIFNRPGRDVSVNDSGETIAIKQSEVPKRIGNKVLPSSSRVTVFSLAENRLLGEMPICRQYPEGFYTSVHRDGYVLTWCIEGTLKKPSIFNVRTKEKRVLVREGYTPTGDFSLDERSSRVASLESSGDGRGYVVLWDMRTGQVLDQSEVTLKADYKNSIDGSVSFSPDGEFLFVSTYAYDEHGETYLTLFRTNGLRRVAVVPQNGVMLINAVNQDDNTGTTPRVILTWPNASGGTFLWDTTETEPRLLTKVTLRDLITNPPDIHVSVSSLGVRSIKFRTEKGRVEIWDLKAGEKVRDIDIPDRFNEVIFTIGGNAVSVNVEGGTVSLFRAEDGEKITDEIRNIGGSQRVIYYDEKCRRVHVWTDEGRVLRYTEGWYLFGRESWFWPAVKCAAQ